MKNVLILATITILYCNQYFAQCPNHIIGIFRSETAFKSKELSLPSPCNSGSKNKIIINDLFKTKYLSIKTDGGKIKMLKDSIYGYQLGNNTFYRFQDNEAFKILDTSTAIIIYHMNLPQINKGKINITRYRYSNGLTGIIKNLSVKNFLTDFAYNIEFCNAVKSNFKYNTELVEIDACTKEYKILALIRKYLIPNK